MDRPRVSVVYVAFANYPYAEIPDGRLGESAAGHYRRVLEMFADHDQAKITLALTGQTKERIHRDMPEVLDLIRGLQALGRLELAGCCYSHPNPALLPQEALRRQIEVDLRLARDLFGVDPRFFWSPESTWTPSLGALLNELGLQSIYLRQLKGAGRSAQLATPRGFINAFGDDTRFGLGEHALVEPHRLRAHVEAVLAAAEETGSMFWPAFCGDLEIAGSGHHLRTFGELLSMIDTEDYLEGTTVSEYLEAHPPTEKVELPGLSNWVGHQRWWAGCALDLDQNARIERARRGLKTLETLEQSGSPVQPGHLLRVQQQLMVSESTENRGWRPGVDRRLWGRSHAIRGCALASGVAEQSLAATEMPGCPEAEAAPWQIVVPLVETEGLPRAGEIVRVPVTLPRRLVEEGLVVSVGGRPVPAQAVTGSPDFAVPPLRGLMEEDPDDLDAVTEIAFMVDCSANSVQFAHIYPGPASPPWHEAPPLTAAAAPEVGGAISEATLDGNEVLNGGHIGSAAYTSSRTLARTYDTQSAATVTPDADWGGLMAQWSTSQVLPVAGAEVLKSQQVSVQLNRVIHILTMLSFRRPIDVGVRPPALAEALDMDLVVGDVTMPAATGTWSATLPLSDGEIQSGEVRDGDPPCYPIAGEGWLDLRVEGRGVALVGDPAISPLHVARICASGGKIRAGLRVGSPRLQGANRPDERPGAWTEDLITSLYYLPHSGAQLGELRAAARSLAAPLYHADVPLGLRVGTAALRFQRTGRR